LIVILDMPGVILIKLSVRKTRKEVMAFLERLKNILNGPDFNMNLDLIIIKTRKSKDKEMYSTPYTLVDLNYNAEDIAERLKELTVQDYSESLLDKDDLHPPVLYVFGKDINGRQIYIKLKIKDSQTEHILCVSFHYAEGKMVFPYG